MMTVVYSLYCSLQNHDCTPWTWYTSEVQTESRSTLSHMHSECTKSSLYLHLKSKIFLLSIVLDLGLPLLSISPLSSFPFTGFSIIIFSAGQRRCLFPSPMRICSVGYLVLAAVYPKLVVTSQATGSDRPSR